MPTIPAPFLHHVGCAPSEPFVWCACVCALQYEELEDAELALKKTNLTALNGRTISVEYCQNEVRLRKLVPYSRSCATRPAIKVLYKEVDQPHSCLLLNSILLKFAASL